MDLKKISDFEWEIPVEDGMNVPGRVFASEKLIENIKKDKSLEQVKNVAKLPGIVGASYAMADAHQGYGFSIGGVAGFDVEKGVVCPGGVGFDINCGVRVLVTNIDEGDFMEKRKEVLHSVFRSVPSGVGRGRKKRLSREELDDILREGAEWAVKKVFGIEEDLEKCEEGGRMKEANPEFVSDKAKSRGLGQLGTLGAGNHFLEFQRVEKIYDEKVAKVFGIEEGKVIVMIHCGSRGLGHQVASDYIKKIGEEYGFPEFDRELVNAPIKSELGKEYLGAMNCAVNFAFCNRQLITHHVRAELGRYFPDCKLDLVYDVCHNIAKFEEFGRAGKRKKLLVMRKGATRSFGPGRVEVPEVYRKVGQPVIIPGSMGTSSYILVGTKKAMEVSFGSTSHGAGRVMSRHEAWKKFSKEGVAEELKSKDVEFEAGSRKGIVEEAPGVYKDVDEIVRVSDELGIGKLVARLKPLAVMKG
jgi:tRNA-splicing ligase RtcB